MIDLLKYHIANSEIFLTACTDQLLYNLSLITFGMYNKKHKWWLFNISKIDIAYNLAGKPPSSLIINFEQVTKSFLVSNIYFIYFCLIALFYKSTEE